MRLCVDRAPIARLAVAILSSLFWLSLDAALSRAEEIGCRGALRVIGATAIYRTPTLEGRAVRRDVWVDVEVSSTSTVPISAVQLGVFLGASLRAIRETRPTALPTARPRELEDGGLAFRAEVTALIGPGATRILRIEKTMLPIDRDLSTVTAVIAGCRMLHEVGEVMLPPVKTSREGTPPVALAAAALGILAAVVLIVRWFR